MKSKIATIGFLIFTTVPAFAQEQVTQGTIPKLVSNIQNYLILMTSVIVFATIMVLIKAVRSLTEKIAPVAKKPIVPEVIVSVKETTGFWTRLNTKLNAAVPLEQEADVLLDHDYDGIKELDNNLPPWWKYGFYITIVWAFFYMIDYHVVGAGNVGEQEYEAQLAEAEIQKEERLKLAANSVDENTVTAMLAANDISDGKKLFSEKCAVCHGQKGEGTVGPNLTDDYWLHGGKINDVFKTIKYGVPAKGMLAWQGQLTPIQIQQVSSFIKSLHGSNPENPKAPQGDLYTESSSDKAVSDSTGNTTTDSLTVTALK